MLNSNFFISSIVLIMVAITFFCFATNLRKIFLQVFAAIGFYIKPFGDVFRNLLLFDFALSSFKHKLEHKL